MARRSLRPQLNQIRTWVSQGRTDAWIAFQLQVTPQQIAAFKRDHDLDDGEPAAGGVDFDDEIDLRAEDDALIAAELDAAEAAKAEEADDEDDEAEEEEPKPKPRRRSRRGGARKRASSNGGAIEGTFDHGEEGYGLWLDPAVQDDPVYAEHWAGHRPITVTVEPERIVITRAGENGASSDEEDA